MATIDIDDRTLSSEREGCASGALVAVDASVSVACASMWAMPGYAANRTELDRRTGAPVASAAHGGRARS